MKLWATLLAVSLLLVGCAVPQNQSSSPPPTSSAESREADRTHTFQADDTLWGLAEQHLGDGSRWREIAELNGISDPTAIPNGLVLRIPDNGSTYRETASVTTQQITSSCGTDQVQELIEEIDRLAWELVTEEPPDSLELMPDWLDDRLDKDVHLGSRVYQWAECLDGASTSLRSYQSAYTKWVLTEGVVLKLMQGCYLTGSGWFECFEDIVSGFGLCLNASMELMTRAFVEGGPKLPWSKDAIFPYPEGFDPADVCW
jgi:hypothetical protein